MHKRMLVGLLAGLAVAGATAPGIADTHTRQWLLLRLAETLALEDRCPGLFVDTGRLVELEASVDGGGDIFADARPAAAEIGQRLTGATRDAACAAALALYGAGGAFADGLMLKRN